MLGVLPVGLGLVGLSRYRSATTICAERVLMGMPDRFHARSPLADEPCATHPRCTSLACMPSHSPCGMARHMPGQEVLGQQGNIPQFNDLVC